MHEDGDVLKDLNPDSLEILEDCRVEPELCDVHEGKTFQFERLGYFFTDPVDSQPGQPVFNRIVTLKDTWAKISQ